MKDEAVNEAAAEARRFLARWRDYRVAMRNAGGNYACPVESGALRRASLDLTRALAAMRRS